MNTSSSTKRDLAEKSLQFNLRNEEFCEIFPLEEFEDCKGIIQMKERITKGEPVKEPQLALLGKELNKSGFLMSALVLLLILYVAYKFRQ